MLATLLGFSSQMQNPACKQKPACVQPRVSMGLGILSGQQSVAHNWGGKFVRRQRRLSWLLRQISRLGGLDLYFLLNALVANVF